MLVNTKVHEAVVDQIRPGMRAKITIDAFPRSETQRRRENRRAQAGRSRLVSEARKSIARWSRSKTDLRTLDRE